MYQQLSQELKRPFNDRDLFSLLRRQLLIIPPWASFVTVILTAQRLRTRNGEKREEELPAKKRRVWTDAGTFVDQ